MRKKILLLLAACIAYAASATVASAFMLDWKLNLAGSGLVSSQTVTVNEYLDTAGSSLIHLTPTGGGAFTFTDFGVFTSFTHDSFGLNGLISPSLQNELTATFSDTGTGTLGGSIGFDTGGILRLYSDTQKNYGSNSTNYGANDGTLIAQFRVLNGNATVNTTGLPNGQISLSLQADAAALVNGFLPGYFFDPTGKDLSTFSQPLVLGFATTGASLVINPNSNLVGSLDTLSGLTYNSADPDFLLVSNNGQYRLNAIIPESGTLALIGAGLLSLTIFGKRHMKKEC